EKFEELMLRDNKRYYRLFWQTQYHFWIDGWESDQSYSSSFSNLPKYMFQVLFYGDGQATHLIGSYLVTPFLPNTSATTEGQDVRHFTKTYDNTGAILTLDYEVFRRLCTPQPEQHRVCNQDGRLVCETDHYGPNCDKICVPNHHGTCDKLGHLICNNSYYGPKCDVHCVPTGQNTCDNNGKLRCQPNYYGTQCDVHCVSTIHGRCDPHGKLRCFNYYYGPRCNLHCEATGYTGQNCGQNIDECMNITCFNGGSCIDRMNAYTCVCSSGYSGPHCEVDIEKCRSNPCHNNGTCVNHNGDFFCACANGWTGSACDVNIDDCINVMCMNNGTCVDRVGSFECQCEASYTGDLCNTKIYDPCASSPCNNGRRCQTSQGRYICSCPDGFVGPLCGSVPQFLTSDAPVFSTSILSNHYSSDTLQLHSSHASTIDLFLTASSETSYNERKFTPTLEKGPFSTSTHTVSAKIYPDSIFVSQKQSTNNIVSSFSHNILPTRTTGSFGKMTDTIPETFTIRSATAYPSSTNGVVTSSHNAIRTKVVNIVPTKSLITPVTTTDGTTYTSIQLNFDGIIDQTSLPKVYNALTTILSSKLCSGSKVHLKEQRRTEQRDKGKKQSTLTLSVSCVGKSLNTRDIYEEVYKAPDTTFPLPLINTNHHTTNPPSEESDNWLENNWKILLVASMGVTVIMIIIVGIQLAKRSKRRYVMGPQDFREASDNVHINPLYMESEHVVKLHEFEYDA
ncbi:protein eyes shut-like, partial [Mizuhopecten yessoensis]|uniref:protein eyes shut-like n=1 Tax=Mizuhopecten yessoensis TaxID=6573 RepID=UPI000B45F8A4